MRYMTAKRRGRARPTPLPQNRTMAARKATNGMTTASRFEIRAALDIPGP
jgi:hypothetical protein